MKNFILATFFSCLTFYCFIYGITSLYYSELNYTLWPKNIKELVLIGLGGSLLISVFVGLLYAEIAKNNNNE